MSATQAMLERARPHMLAARAKEFYQLEVSKGCSAMISPRPVALEPVYQPLLSMESPPNRASQAAYSLEDPPNSEHLVRLRIWVSPEQKCDWLRSELFLKQLSYAAHRIVFEIIGNEQEIAVQLLAHLQDLPVIQAAFRGQCEQSAIVPMQTHSFRGISPEEWAQATFLDFYPDPPYSHLFTTPSELKRSPYSTLIAALASIPRSALGLYQVVLVRVSPEHDWHQNVQALLDLEYRIKLLGGVTDPHRYAQQVPSAPLPGMSHMLEHKANSDKPFFASALRIAVVGAGQGAERILQSLTVIGSLIQHGGRPLRVITGAEYRQHLEEQSIGRMLEFGLTHRPGFLVNSWELASLAHIPPPETIEHVQARTFGLEPLQPSSLLEKGTPIGTCLCAGRLLPVCIPDGLRCTHTHLIGRPGKGKSTVLEHMILHDIIAGHGAVVLDPHGRLVRRLLTLIPPEHADRIIYFNPGDRNWIPLWNPIRPIPGQDVGRTADNLVDAFKKIVTNWGDRLENLLREAFYAALSIPDSTLLDVSNMLRNKTKESRIIREEVLQVIDNEMARQFWLHDYEKFGKDDLGPPKNKLSKLLISETVYLMLSQPQSAFNLTDIMEQGKVLLVDLSEVSAQVCELLGCFMLELLRLTALSRDSSTPETHSPFHIYCDEAHRFLTDAVEDLIAETRKFNVSLTLAHQYLNQFPTRVAGAVANVGAAVIFNVDTKDAQFLRKDLQGLVEVDDLITQKTGEAVVRIDTEIVRVRTDDAQTPRSDHCRDQIIERSRRDYYRPIEEVRTIVRRRTRRGWEPLSYPDSHRHTGITQHAADARPRPRQRDRQQDSAGTDEAGHEVF